MLKSTVNEIQSELISQEIPFFANDNISEVMTPFRLNALQLEVEHKVSELLKTLLINTEKDHNTKDTAKRIAKMFIHETLSGRYKEPPKITIFPNTKKLDQLAITQCDVKSLCSHHFQNIIGKCYIGILYDEYLLGLSKFNRIVTWFSRRPQIQEELVEQIADYINDLVKPKALGIIIRAEHHCAYCRGVEQEGNFITSAMRGELRTNQSMKNEFLQLIQHKLK